MVSFAAVMSKLTAPRTADLVRDTSQHYGKLSNVRYRNTTQLVPGIDSIIYVTGYGTAGSNKKPSDYLELFLDSGRFKERGDLEMFSFPKFSDYFVVYDSTGRLKLFHSEQQR